MTDEQLRTARDRLVRAGSRVVLGRIEARAVAAELVRLERELAAVRERARAELDRRRARWRGPPDTLVCHAVRWVAFADPWPATEGGPDPACG